MDPAIKPLGSLAFGRFQVLPHRRELLADGESLKLGGRAYDVLMTLIEARGAVVSRNALMARVWPGRAVEENALQAQISALRAAFGVERELIRTVSGRGYQFTGEIRIQSTGSDARAGPVTALVEPGSAISPTNLADPVSELIGRDDELREVVSLATSHRLVTVTGPGGIGKTQLALAAARRLRQEFTDGVWVAELAPLADPGLVPAAVAAAVGLELGAGAGSPERVASALSSKQTLLVLDNCEHVIAAATTMAEALLRANPAAHLIATSTEPLRAEAEWVYPLPPLAVPARNAQEGDDLLRCGAARLFVERVRAAEPHFEPDQRSAATIASICRQLDGIPLAIELAAARAAVLGVKELAAHLDNRFHLLTGGRRTALPRHQTLRAMLDWSFGLLPERERAILRRLAIFVGSFRLEAASAVVASAEIAPSEVVEGLSDLVSKSLVSASVDGTIAGYRLLETTRAYALEKLADSGEYERLARRHAEYYRDLFEQAEAEWERQPTAEWLADYGRKIDNLRAALDWSFSPSGDASVGVALTGAAVPLWVHLSLLDECRTRVEQAIATIEGEGKADARREMKLYAALGLSLVETRGPLPAAAAWTKVLAIAETLEDTEYQLRALGGLYMHHITGGEYRAAVDISERLCNLAENRPDSTDWLVGNRMVGTALHLLGNQNEARRYLETMLSRYATPVRRLNIVRFQFDQRITAQSTLARVLWLQGYPDQATRTTQTTLEEAQELGHELSLCNTLAQAACPVALDVGDLDAAEHYTALLLEHAERYALTRHAIQGRGFRGALLIRRGAVEQGIDLLRSALEDLRKTSFVQRYPTYLAALAHGLRRAGRTSQGLLAIDEGLAHCERCDERWCIAELLRIKGELLLAQGEADTSGPEEQFLAALDWARRQGALSWELRTAKSLARLRRSQGHSANAIALLQPVYNRFTEGFATADLRAAKTLLDALR